MTTAEIEGVRIDGVMAALPATAETNVEAPSTGIRCRRIAAAGETQLDLVLRAAKAVIAAVGAKSEEFGAVISVAFTAPRMPATAVQAQARLGLPKSVIAFDVSMACSGYGYGLYLAGLTARQTGKRVLLLDGDVQSKYLDPADIGTKAVLADGGTATIVSPRDGGRWRFAFLADGEKGGVLTLPSGGKIAMDGFAVFKFVASEVVSFLREFMAATSLTAAAVEAFVPHQANVYLIRQLAQSLGIAAERLWVSADEFGNLSSASVPATLAKCGQGGRERVLLAGFGGGLSISAALVDLPADCRFGVLA